MKKLFLFALIAGMFQFSYAQDQTILDGAYKKDIRDGGDDRKIQGYQHVREADVMWSTKIERVINLREKINQVFYYPIQEIDDRRNLIDVLMDAVKEGTITAYGNAYKDDEFKSPMSQSDINSIGIDGEAIEITEIYDDEIEDYRPDTIINIFARTNVRKYRIKEEWYFDKQRSVMDFRIIGLCPVMDRYDDNGIYRGESSLFWVYFPEARTVLSKAEVFNHRKNDAARLTYDDIFHKRFFNSYIVKESNKYNRKITEYKEGIDALLEAEAIQEEIFNLEHDLWEY
ncbi:MAG: gliding motility protein GldN [Flavobacteriales bacterium]|tara:strand:- start:796 stop:1653 length:858 start_codon:yes stop_codon:yes gene_type:complete